MSNLFAELLDDDIIIEEVVPIAKRSKIVLQLDVGEDTKDDKLNNGVTVNGGESSGSHEQPPKVTESSNDNGLVAESKLSKRERKRQLRWQEQDKFRKEKRKKAKSRKKERKKLALEAGVALPVKSHEVHKMIDSKCKIRVAVDLSFEKLMNDSSIRKTLSQLNFCYATNRKFINPLQFYIVNLRGKTKALFESRVGNNRWDVFVMEEALEEVWRPEEIVYLSADSNNVLEVLDENKTYVIGGLVDHNAHKGVCHKLAVSKGFSHARLPIDEFVKLQTRKVLTINHVFEILLNFSLTKNWEDAFFSVIPKRKGIQKISNEEAEQGLQDDVETDENTTSV